ncbi:ABC transporter permease [Clostridium cellulovorans]|uniref:Binding-protein-dependent transport systems inner membrane component n=1 Tax=Clostridium cellulovorans (strain ATCC 35296 / DSM 3052 / OCM 3 / 743B) TaxID=573061 RepID=D9SMF6_CLOC7|nr:ABC transporter permease subunit [Clostridium cellulovorans]ADL53812.1 binding-protein-dependent transport systems inner membrane component [Clostridium cellulovorans 743B]
MKKYIWTKNNKEKLIAIIVFLSVWEVASLIIDNEIYLPSLRIVAIDFLKIIEDKDFGITLYSTLYRTVVSFWLALAIAVIFGGLALMNMSIRNLLVPLNAIAKSMPTMILVVLSLIWVDKDNAPLVVGVAIALPIVYDTILSSIERIDKNIVEMLNVYRVNRLEKFKHIYLPTVAYSLVGILSSTISLILKVVIAGEVHGQPRYGIGAMVQIEKVNFNTPAIFSWILIIALIGLIFQGVETLISKLLFRWREENDHKNKESKQKLWR